MTTNNHPTHGPVSLDRLHQISEILSKAATQSDGGNFGYAMADAVKVIDVAITAFCAEPVAYLYSASFERGHVEGELTDAPGCDMPVYTSSPVPVSAPGESSIFDAAIDICRKSDAIDEHAWNHGVLAVMSAFRACRDAMLQAGNSPATPDGWIPVSDRMPEKADEVLCAKEFDGPGDWRQKVGYYLAGKWTVYGASWTPTHWMPLPASPKGEHRDA